MSKLALLWRSIRGFCGKLQEQNLFIFNLSMIHYSSLFAKFQGNQRTGCFQGSSQNTGTCIFTIGINIENCHFPHFEADLKSTTVAIFLKLQYVTNLYHFYLMCKNIKFCRLVFSGGHLKMSKCTKFCCIFGILQMKKGSMDSFKSLEKEF